MLKNIKEKEEEKKNYWLLFIDFSSAYNKINHNILYSKLKMVGVK